MKNPKALIWKAADRLGEGIISDTPLEKLGVAPVCLAPGEISDGHSHTGVEEINVFRAGTGQIQIENDVIDVCAGMVAVIPSGRFHEVRNTGAQNLEYVAVFDSDLSAKQVILRSKEEHFDPSVPMYFRMLNTIAAGEAAGAKAFRCWSESTSNAELAGVLRAIATRETEHSAAFEKRLVELGRTPDLTAVDPFVIGLLAYLASDASDLEKLERLQLLVGEDQFGSMFADPAIDPETGALLGRYIAELRDSGRMLKRCYDALARTAAAQAAAEPRSAALPDRGDEFRALREDLSSLRALMSELKDALGQRSSA